MIEHYLHNDKTWPFFLFLKIAQNKKTLKQ